MLMDQIIQAKQGSQADMLSLLQQFQPILKKYGRKLWGEDGLEDMTAAFLQVIHDMKPEQIVPCGGGRGPVFGAVCAPCL